MPAVSPQGMGQSWLQQQDMEGPSLNPKITATHPLALSDVDDGRVSAQLLPHLVHPESPSAWGHEGAVLPMAWSKQVMATAKTKQG